MPERFAQIKRISAINSRAFDLDLAGEAVAEYLLPSLHSGKLIFLIAPHYSGNRDAIGMKGYADFYTKENLVGVPVRIELVVSLKSAQSTPPKIDRLRVQLDGSVVLRFPGIADQSYTIEHSSDLKTWIPVEKPGIQFRYGVGEWLDSSPLAESRRFYRSRLAAAN